MSILKRILGLYTNGHHGRNNYRNYDYDRQQNYSYPNNQTETTVCPYCKANIDLQSKFCGQCGKNIGMSTCSCGELIRPGDKYCGKCGKSL